LADSLKVKRDKKVSTGFMTEKNKEESGTEGQILSKRETTDFAIEDSVVSLILGFCPRLFWTIC
jgi:hypothetical protein